MFISASPTQGGNCDSLIAAMKATIQSGAETHQVNVCEKIGYCRACYGCRKDEKCIQNNDYIELLRPANKADAIIAAVPIDYNYMAAQMIIAIDYFEIFR